MINSVSLAETHNFERMPVGMLIQGRLIKPVSSGIKCMLIIKYCLE